MKDMQNLAISVMILIIMALSDFIKKQDLLKLRGKMDKLSCEKYYRKEQSPPHFPGRHEKHWR